MITALSSHYNVKLFNVNDDLNEVLSEAQCVAFPGGIGDSDSFYEFFKRRHGNRIERFLSDGGKYLGICMGAYWAGSNYFDILDGIDCVQYIKRPTTDIKRSYATIADIEWLGKPEKMFFYDGCTFVGSGKYNTIAKYSNDEPMAMIQNNVGIIGCHPESEEFWYNLYPYIKKNWHDGKHHKLLLDFVDKLMLP